MKPFPSLHASRHFRDPSLSCLAGLLLAASPALVHAADASAPKDDVVQLSEFTVSESPADRYRAADAISAVRVRAPLIDTASSITVLTREMIDDLAPTRLFDVTRYVAGVQDGRGIQFQDRMIMRGFESNGQRTVDNFLQPADADNIDEGIIERIEVTKGPNAILSPSGAPGGSLNVITKSPLYKQKRSVTALVGLFDAQKVSLDMTGPFAAGSPFAYRLVGSLQDSRRYWSDDSRLRGKVLAPMFSWRVSRNTQLTVKLVAAEHWIFREPLLVVDSAVNGSTSDPFLAPGIREKSRNGIQPWSHVDTHSADLFTLLTSTLNENVSVRFAANGRYYFEDSDQEFLSTPSLTNRYNPMTGELTQDQTWALAPGSATTYVPTFSRFIDPTAIPVRGDLQATRRKTANAQADIVGNYKFPNVSSQTVAGFAYSRQTAYGRGRTGTLPPINLNAPSLEVYPVYPNTFAFYNANTFTNVQAFVNERLSFLQERLHITGGVLRFDTKTTARNVLTGAAPSILDDHKDMWSAGALFKVQPNVSLYYSYSTNSSPVIANNVPLWRDGVQDEFGFKTEFFNQRLSINGAYFQIEQTNVTVPNPDRQTNPAAPEQLVSDFGNHGIEFEIMGSLTPNLSAIVTYSQLKMRDSLGRHVRGVADRNAAALLSYRFKDGALKGLSVNAGASYSGRRAGDTPINFTPLGVVGRTSFFLKPHTVTTLGASYRWQEKYFLRLNVDNVLNEKGYLMVAGGRVSGTGITTAPGMNVKLSTTVSF